jgi:pyrimidine deaminase RibD-like protein
LDLLNDEQFMLRALALSKLALPNCRPNPPVGCVLVKDNTIVSEGYTQAPGQHHAEAQAISHYVNLVDDGALNDITAYVTLEPCSFVGRTPSCAHTLAGLNIKRVVVAMLDPDPRNSGKGIKVLTDAGIDVDIGVCQDEVSVFISPYLLG